MPEVVDQDYEKFKSDIMKLCGIDLNAYKERQMKRRIQTLSGKFGCKDFASLYQDLKVNENHRKQFMNYLTINVSEFYRNPAQWKVVEKEIIPELLARHNNQLNVWSAACSTGDEPYTIVMTMKELFPKARLNLLATDLDDLVIEYAKEGVYPKKSIVGLPKAYQDKYFTKTSDGMYQIAKEIKDCVKFKQHNLLADRFGRDYDLIFCRNVLIYFTDEAKEETFKKFNQSLRPQGYLFIGSTEQMLNARDINFEPYQSFFYKKIK